MKRLVALLTALCLAITPVAVLAEEDTTDVLDNSAELERVEEIGIPTEKLVNEMKKNADTLYNNGEYQEAADLFYDTAKKANYLANIMSQCIEPFYDSSEKDAINKIPSIIKNDLVDMETKSNKLKSTRNTCYVYQGLCYSKMGDTETALAILFSALDLIELTESNAWVSAVQEIMKIIEYK